MSDLRTIPITENQRQIMLHALGSDNVRKPSEMGFRNYFSSDANDDLNYLCEHGFMVLARKGNDYFPDNCYQVTPEACKMLGVTVKP